MRPRRIPSRGSLQEAPPKRVAPFACRLVIMVRLPLAGRVKTRLTPSLSPAAAAGVYAYLLERTMLLAAEAQAVGNIGVSIHAELNRSKQKRADVTVLNEVRMTFTIGGTDSATAAQLVEGFRRR